MHVISRRRLLDFAAVRPEAYEPLDRWYRIAKRARLGTFAEVRRDFAHADQVGELTIFNVAGNKIRLITIIEFDLGKIFIRHVLTHAEYDKGGWKP